MYYITERDVTENFTMRQAIEALREAFIELYKGHAKADSRSRNYSSSSVLSTMPAVIDKYGISGLKVYNASREGASFLVLLFNNESSKPIAIIEADRLGQIRTGAATALATSILHEKCEVFTLIGSGFQAETQLEGIISISDPNEIRVYSRNIDHARSFAKKMKDKFGREIETFADLKTALSGSDVITSITNSSEAFIKGDYLSGHYHLNLAGANIVGRREAEPSVFEHAELVVVEHLEQALKESSEIIEYLNNGGHVFELKNVVVEPVRYSPPGRTIFKSMGIGLEDLISGYYVLKNMGLI
jgi:alanine dehydrogenase